MRIGPVVFGNAALPLIAGPCVIENREHTLFLAGALKEITNRLGIPFIFKASFDKANRTSGDAYRGPGLENGLAILAEVKARFNLPLLTDIHQPDQAEPAARVVDVLQIPAFLCRQTDLLQAAAETGLTVNVKKGQFLAPSDMANVAEKLRQFGAIAILLTDRGTQFGYNNLVSDMRAIPIMRESGVPVIFDATHSAQLPGGAGTATAGQREYIPTVARAAVAAGCDGLFMEVHDHPDQALSDAATQWPLNELEQLLSGLAALRNVTHGILSDNQD